MRKIMRKILNSLKMYVQSGRKLLLSVILTVFVFTIFLLLSNNPRHQLQDGQTYYVEDHGHDMDYNGDQVIEELLYEELPSIAPYYRNASIVRPHQINDSCAHFPQLYHLKINNKYWQSLKSANGSFQLYGAYLDTRPKDMTLRILGMVDIPEPNVTLHCHLWISGVDVAVIVPVDEIQLIWEKRFGMLNIKAYYTHLLSCTVPLEHRNKNIISVSLVEDYCDDAQNNLKVWHNQGKRQGFAVCVKGLDFPRNDMSVRLIEWIEFLLLLGVDKIHFYNLQTHQGSLEALRYYEKRGNITLTELTLPESQPNLPKLQHYFLNHRKDVQFHDELVPYNDCFYKHMYQHEFIALLDIDEVIVPREDNNWKDMILTQKARAASMNKTKITNFSAQNVYFLDEFNHQHEWHNGIPHEYHMLQHVQRTGNFSPPGYYTKSLFDTSQVVALHNHFPFTCLGACDYFFMPKEEVQMSHYRGDCNSSNQETCEEMKKNVVEDKIIWKWKDELIRRVDMTVTELRNHRLRKG